MRNKYLEALIMGVCIALTVVLLQAWLGDSSLPLKMFGLAIAGILLCFVQYGLGRLSRPRR